MRKNSESLPSSLLQFVKFGIVGVSNTLITYVTEMLGYYVVFVDAQFSTIAGKLGGMAVTASAEQIRVVVVTLIGFVLSVTNAYYWNSRYVFKSGEKRRAIEHVKAYLRTVLCYALTGLVLSPAIKLWLGAVDIPFYLASLGSLVITIPLNFVLNKFWAFGVKK